MLVQSAAVAGKDKLDINKGDYDKRTALAFGSRGRSLSTLSFLCEAGAEVNVEDRLRRPLMMPTWEVTNHAPRY
jgi:hypothetical protein